MAYRYYYKDYELSDGLVYSANLLAQSAVLNFTDVAAEDTLCGLGIGHAFNLNQNSIFGKGFNINVIERLTADISLPAENKIYTYIDYFGNSYTEDFGYFKDFIRSEYEPNIIKSIPSYKAIDNLTGQERKNFRPIRWLVNDKIIKGFNLYGNLVFICDRNGNYYHIKGENYDSEYGDCRPTHIKQVPSDCTDYNEAKDIYRFEYNEDEMLSKILDVDGKVLVSYVYEGDTLKSVKFKSGLAYSFEYMKGNVRQIETSNKFTISITPSGISVMSSVDGVPSDNGVSTFNEISSFTFDFSNNITTVTKDKDNFEKFIFRDGKLSYYYLYENGRYIAAEKHTEENKDVGNYKNALIKTVYKADRETLFGTVMGNITFGKGEYDRSTFAKIYVYRYLSAPYEAYKLINNEKREYANSLDTFNYKSSTFEYHISSGSGYFNRENVYINIHGSDKRIEHTIQSFYDAYDRISKVLKQISDDTGLGEFISYDYASENYLAFPTCITSCKTEKNNITKQTHYDVYGRVTQEKDVLNRYTKYTYKNGTRRISVTEGADGINKFYSYNENGKPMSIMLNDFVHSFNYTDGELTGIKKPNTQIFDYTYDEKRSLKAVKYFSAKTEEYTYSDSDKYDYSTHKFADGKGMCIRTTKSNGTELCSFDGVAQFQNTYYENGLLKKQSDYLTDIFSDYAYNDIGRLIKVSNANLTEAYGYDSYGNITSLKLSGACNYNYSYTYSDSSANRLTQMTVSTYTVTPLYDKIGRSTGKKIAVNVGTGTSFLTQTIIYSGAYPYSVSYDEPSVWIGYKYNAYGNITNIENNAKQAYFVYERNNRLKREDNERLNKTIIYTYDHDGNRTHRYVYAYSRATTPQLLKNTPLRHDIYTYNSRMQLLSDGNTNGFTYDGDGNPTKYRGHTLTWQKGMLTSYAGIALSYDGYGRRSTKNGITFTYDSNNRLIKQSNGLEFLYDESGVMAFKYKEKLYTYLKDIQGNIIGIIDSAKTLIAKYEYDAWGNFTVYDGSGNVLGTSETLYQSTNAVWNINPFRYRGYYYDIETGLYYLLSRYYDPEVGRFISLDNSGYADPDTINGLNLYLYCNNNPVMNVDPTGHFWLAFWAIVGTLVLGAGISGVVNGIIDYATGGDYWGAFAGGFVSGLLSTIGLAVSIVPGGWMGAAIALFFGFGAGFAGSVVQQGIDKGWNNIDYVSAAKSGGITMGLSLITFGITNFVARNSVGVFDSVIDKTLKLSVRITASFSISISNFLYTSVFLSWFNILDSLINKLI